ncbi:hypothetical protein ACIF83_39985 [Streptomyces sp. NPDC085866]|uniref:hypothetical protein n=1 Tax=Streptomyces sp. NPDC085866 TaxID=3365736 RepID=UPI0037D3175E
MAEPAADGDVIREGPSAMRAVEKGTRVPAPHGRRAGGRVKVAALWPVVWQSSDAPFRLFVNNGWSVEQPGNFPDGLDPMYPSRDLSYEVRVYTVPDGIVGEDHWGGAPRWWTTAWCTDLDKARELADALGSHRLHTTERPPGGNSGDLRAEVWEHLTTDRSTLPNRVHRADADPGRPKAPQLPFDTWPPGRPHSPAPTPEPTWFPNEKHPPHYELKEWNEDRGWTSLAWLTGGRTPAGVAATLLQVGTGRPLRLRRDLRTALPRHLAARLDAGRPVPDRPPPGPYAEDSARLKAERRAEEEYLVAALAERSRGALTIDQVAKRLRVGGQEYRDFLHIGTVCIKDALHHAHRAAEGTERLRLREALDALENRHEVADWVADLTHAHLATDLDDGGSGVPAPGAAGVPRTQHEHGRRPRPGQLLTCDEQQDAPACNSLVRGASWGVINVRDEGFTRSGAGTCRAPPRRAHTSRPREVSSRW